MSSNLSNKTHWASRIMGGIVILFLAFDSIIKVMKESHAIESTVQLGYPESAVMTIGIIETVCLILYIIPRTSLLGAILLTGHLGGAIATHVRMENPLFSHTLFPVYVAILLWGSLYLRDEKLRELVPLRKG
jgi:hypothetical protein